MKPLAGIHIIEFATVGGIPFCAWLLAQHGAKVTRIRAPQPRELGVAVAPEANIGQWGREEIVLDLKSPAGRDAAFAHIDAADVVIEGYRPGVMERLGLGPDPCRLRNPGLVYGRLVGWNRNGPWAQSAGHDINYIAMAGILHSIGPETIPLNLAGDIAGGALYLAFGIAAALQARSASGHGCVVDAAMTDGALHMLSAIFGRLDAGAWVDASASNVIDGGVPWYRTYATADGRYMAVGAIEERFYANFLRVLGLRPEELPSRDAPNRWPELAALFASRFRQLNMADWAARFDGIDACVTPVLTLGETRTHSVTRQAFEVWNGIPLPQPVPNFSAAQ
jgi:alpha-methylacyl-CoA racemase